MRLPAVAKYVPSKADPRMQWGVLLGYSLAPGGHWNGEYLVVDFSDFSGQSLAMDADGYDYRITPHITKQVRFGSEGIVFPLKARYAKQNLCIDGIDPIADSSEEKRLADLPRC